MHSYKKKIINFSFQKTLDKNYIKTSKDFVHLNRSYHKNNIHYSFKRRGKIILITKNFQDFQVSIFNKSNNDSGTTTGLYYTRRSHVIARLAKHLSKYLILPSAVYSRRG